MCNYYYRNRGVAAFKEPYGFRETPNSYEPRYVIRPTSIERTVTTGKDGEHHFTPLRWGLAPPWAKDLKMGLTLFDARSETILEKKMFATPFTKGRRCLIPLDGFYEFSGPKGQKQPHIFKAKGDQGRALAGV